MACDVGSRHAVTVGAFGNGDNDPFLLKYPIDPRNPPVAVLCYKRDTPGRVWDTQDVFLRVSVVLLIKGDEER